VDPVSRRELWQIVYRLVREERMSVLLSTAYLDEAERCDEVILLHRGKLLGQGPPAAFSEPMQGRTWRIAATGAGKRRLQHRIGQNPAVDALSAGSRAWCWKRRRQPPGSSVARRAGRPCAALRDAFIARLKSPRSGPREALLWGRRSGER
jgi:ABC-2 type transport system ATP-binding protein